MAEFSFHSHPDFFDTSLGVNLLCQQLERHQIQDIFGFNEQELNNALSIPASELFKRKITDDSVLKQFQKSMWRVYQFRREYERFKVASRSNLTLQNELTEGIANAWTSFTEYAWGKNTRFYLKLLIHPESKQTKIVMFDPRVDSEESFEQSWNREDLRISNDRFIFHKRITDKKYAEDFSGLRSRDNYEGKLLNRLVEEGKEVVCGKASRVIMSVSPAPPPSRYARRMGYGVSFTKRLSHWRIYSFDRVNDTSAVVHAETVFTYRPNYRLRRLMKDTVCTRNSRFREVSNISILPSHLDILSVPYVSRFSTLSQASTYVDHSLNTDRYLTDYLSGFSYFATRWHREKRLMDLNIARDIFNTLCKKYMWRYYCVLAEGELDRDELLLKEILLLMKEEGEVLYAKKMVDQMEQREGYRFSLKRRRSLEKSFIVSSQIRNQGGLCPTIEVAQTLNNNSDSKESSQHQEEKEERCLIRCKNKWRDWAGKIVHCKWFAVAQKDKTFHECPECQWNHDKPLTLERQLLLEHWKDFSVNIKKNTDLDRSVQQIKIQLDPYDYDFRKIKKYKYFIVDKLRGEIVVLDLLLPLRRLLPTSW